MNNTLNFKPTEECRYGINCYRKNPHHFREYAHKHLKNIRSKERNAGGEYEIPDELFMSKVIVAEQLKILDNLFPTSVSKKAKLEPTKSEIGNSINAPSSNRISEDVIIEDPNLKAGIRKSENITSDQLKESLKNTMEKLTANSLSLQVNQPQPSTSKSNISANKNSNSVPQDQNKSSTFTPTVIQNSTTSQSVKPKRNIHDYIQVVLPKGQMARKLEKSGPYNFFLTAITDSPATHNEPLTVTLQELMDSSLGEIESSVQINFMIDIGWLLGHYYFADCLEKPLLVLYGEETPDLKIISSKKPQVTAIKVEMSSPFATHHSKMMLFGYKDGSMRVIISTANLVEDDWHNRTQGIWISPKCEALPDESDTLAGESETGFKESLTRYLVSYSIPKLQPWIARVRKSDFSKVNVFLVASIPGGHRTIPNKGYQWGHARLGHLLSLHSAPIDDSCPIVAQSSSIGSLGPNLQSWLTTDFINSLRRDSAPIGIRKIPQFKMIYPSFANVKNSHDDLLGGGCLPYRKAVNDKQLWLKEHLNQWKSKCRHRSQAMPHIKTYCRWSDRGLYWFTLTSANLSKAAWGAFNKGSKIDVPLRIMNYEAGVLFLPKFILGKNERFFPMFQSKNDIQPFSIPYDIPLTPFASEDTPFVMDYLL